MFWVSNEEGRMDTRSLGYHQRDSRADRGVHGRSAHAQGDVVMTDEERIETTLQGFPWWAFVVMFVLLNGGIWLYDVVATRCH
jgi:hypothetical protein